MALTKDAKITRFGVPSLHEPLSIPLHASTTVYAGSFALTATADGLVKNSASPASTDTVWGVIQRQVTCGSSSASVSAEIETGSFYFAAGANSDALVQADIGKVVYVIDEVTVGKTTGSGTRPVAGTLLNIDTTLPGGYAVKVGSAPPGTGSP